MEILPLKSAAASEEGASLLTASEDAASGAASLPGASDAAVAALTFEVSVEPQPASTAITRVAAAAIATNFFFIIIFSFTTVFISFAIAMIPVLSKRKKQDMVMSL